MVEVRTRDEAIALVDRALDSWAQSVTADLDQAAAVADGAHTAGERAVRHCASRVAAIEAKLKAAHESQVRQLQAELIRARAAHDQARRALIRIVDVADGVRSVMRAHRRDGVTHVTLARAHLAAMSSALGSYRGSASRGLVPAPVSSTGRSPSGAATKGHGLSEVSVRDADLADTPIQGEFGRGGATRADYRWAVQTWSDTVGPGVARGMTRDEFVARDERLDAPPLRRTADIYDMFLGTDRIRVDRRPDGSLNIVNGRHRLQVAKDLGIDSLPGQVS